MKMLRGTLAHHVAGQRADHLALLRTLAQSAGDHGGYGREEHGTAAQPRRRQGAQPQIYWQWPGPQWVAAPATRSEMDAQRTTCLVGTKLTPILQFMCGCNGSPRVKLGRSFSAMKLGIDKVPPTPSWQGPIEEQDYGTHTRLLISIFM